ncbi:MAG: ABC transporter ATP-binding protein/permease [Alphaproteobacteria bacterium]|nr:ABC transporter ATP-binding protein/permease [Alphaproteobacteria bacterium]
MITLLDRASRPLVKRILNIYVRPYAGWVVQAMLWMVLAAAMSAIFASLVQPVLDDVLINHKDHLVLPLAIGVMLCFVLRGVATYMQTVLMNRTGQHIVSDIQNHVFGHLMGLDIAYFHKNASGTLLSRLTADTSVMRNAVAEGLTNLGKNTLTLFLLVGVMFWRDWALALACFIIFPITATFVSKLGKRLRKLSTRTQEGLAEMAALLTQTFQGIRQVKAYGREGWEVARMKSKIDDVRNLNIKNVRTGTINAPVNDTLVGLCVFGLILYGGHEAREGSLTPGALMSFITAFLMSYEPMKKIAKVNNTLQIGLGAAARVFEIIDTRPTVISGPEKPEMPNPSVRFENVIFGYEGGDGPALDGANFTADAGRVTALVGPSGGGKSTILNLLLRFYDPQAGRILIDGHDIKAMDIGHMRGHIALVSQDITIFDDTALANIAYGREGASEAEVLEAAKAAHAHEFISALPNGYQTRLGENGVSLSGGQRQRIALARAFLKNAPILLLDEATSALDAESEALVQESLGRLQAGRTTLVIAHRLSTIKHASRILLVDKGRVAEEGTHDTLLARGGAYAALYARNQLGGQVAA